MKKSLVVGFVLFSVLFFGCGILTPPDVQERAPVENTDSTDPERKDILALKHLQIPHISEDTLASYVMDFINANDASRTARSVQSVPAVTITKTTKIMHPVETGFAETTADKRSVRSVIGPGQIPFYVFTLENQHSGGTGFALTCGDSRIGAVLAVVEQGNYDDIDNPFMGIFYTGLNAYIENTIGIYNSITEADIENALNKLNEASRSIVPDAPDLPVTDVGKDPAGLKPIGDIKLLDPEYKIRWHQRSPYNDFLNSPSVKNPPDKYHYVTGCAPVAIAQIMAFHGKKRADDNKPNPYPSSKVPGYTNVKYDWNKMIDGNDNKAIGVLMYEIGLPQNAWSMYNLCPKDSNDNPDKKGIASTTTFDINVKTAFRNMGYGDTGSFVGYDLYKLKHSINNYGPVLVSGNSKIKMVILGIPIYESGHFWVVDGYALMSTMVKRIDTGEYIPDYPLDYVHCNLGWSSSGWNGWYISGVFNRNNIPWDDTKNPISEATRSADGVDGFYQYDIKMITGITPK